MIALSTALGLLTQAAAVGAVAAAALRRWGPAPAVGTPPAWPRLLPLAIAALALVPVAGCSLAMVLRGLWNDLSFTTLQLALLALAGRDWLPAGQRRGLAAAIVAAGVLLFPTALGAGPFDLYRSGFQPLPLLGVLGLAGLALCWRAPLLTLLLAVDLGAYALGLADSSNLWDYLLDPVLFLYALILLLVPQRQGAPALEPAAAAHAEQPE